MNAGQPVSGRSRVSTHPDERTTGKKKTRYKQERHLLLTATKFAECTKNLNPATKLLPKVPVSEQQYIS